jgi:excisionase family DNA binding protein
MTGHDATNYTRDARLLRLREVADVLAVSERSVRRLCRAGLLPTVRLGGSVRFRYVDVQSLVERSNEYGDAQP